MTIFLAAIVTVVSLSLSLSLSLSHRVKWSLTDVRAPEGHCASSVRPPPAVYALLDAPCEPFRFSRTPFRVFRVVHANVVTVPFHRRIRFPSCARIHRDDDVATVITRMLTRSRRPPGDCCSPPNDNVQRTRRFFRNISSNFRCEELTWNLAFITSDECKYRIRVKTQCA